MFKKGDRVVVEGYGRRRAILRVWEVKQRGYQLCTEGGFSEMQKGRVAAIVGFPCNDIVGLAVDETIALC